MIAEAYRKSSTFDSPKKIFFEKSNDKENEDFIIFINVNYFSFLFKAHQRQMNKANGLAQKRFPL